MRRRRICSFRVCSRLIVIIFTICITFSIAVHYNGVYKNQHQSKIEQTSTIAQIRNHWNEKNRETQSIFYRLTTDERYHYEFRFEFHPSTKTGDHRLMLILNDAKRSCADPWDFFVGKRILRSISHFDYSILVLCSLRRTYDVNTPTENNLDAKYMYLSLQRWVKEVYYARFQSYPHLYIHATGLGSKFAGILCRILPIQAQLLYISTGIQETMLVPSSYDADLQTRLSLDPTFANWFYFDFCANRTNANSADRKLCPLENQFNHYYYPIPPTFSTYLQDDPYQFIGNYRNFQNDLSNQSFQLGGVLLSHSEALQLDFLHPLKPTVAYLQEYFPVWRDKLYAIRLFFEHFNNPEKYRPTDSKRRTCWCLNIDFKYFENFPNVTRTWNRGEQEEYNDYIKDLHQYEQAFTEEVCGDLLTTQAMVSRNIEKALGWISQIDQLRRSLYLKDYLSRPLRIWMYDKALLIEPSRHYSAQEPNWTHISKEFLMYSPEYLIQHYFQHLNRSQENHDEHFQWAVNPLLADYFIIPSDLMYFYFSHKPTSLNDNEFNKLTFDLNENYFNMLLTSIRTKYPYWTLANREDQIGANHILAVLGGRNMGILTKRIQNLLRNVIQLAFTGVREDLTFSDQAPRYTYRGVHITYRHHYDVILPQFTRMNINRTQSDYIDRLVKKKNQLFYFAGALSHATTIVSARAQLSLLWNDMNNKLNSHRKVQIQKRTYRIITIVDGHIRNSEYIKSIQSSVFALCPEGYLPWSPRLYESIQIGAIPAILADSIVVPFERFIDWRSFSAKINVSNTRNITHIAYRIENLEEYTKEKLKNALPYLYAFQWPYSIITEKQTGQHMFQLQNGRDERAKNVFYYLWLELRCRRLEQWYGLTVNTSSARSLEAQRLACRNHPTICPCHEKNNSLAFKEYL